MAATDTAGILVIPTRVFLSLLPMTKDTQKLYVYVDETGQDVGSEFFITAAIVSAGDQHRIREQLEKIEQQTKIFKRKWYRAGYEQRIEFIKHIIETGHKFGHLYYISYKKPLLFFYLWLEVIALSLNDIANTDYRAQVFVDGIDHKKADELTNTLRARGVKLSLVRNAKDEKEPLIRLADRVAGLVRSAHEQKGEYAKLLKEAEAVSIIKELKTTP